MKFINIIPILFSPLREYLCFIKNKIKYQGKVSFCFGCKIGESNFEGCNVIGENSKFTGCMGYGSYMSSNCSIEGEIGRFTSIGPEVICPRGIHPYRPPFVATSPMFFSLNQIMGHTFATKQTFQEWRTPVKIGNDCWIGARVILTGDIKISDGVVVYSGSVVTKSVPPYAIVAGVPAKIIGYRYDQSTIDFLLELRWWDKSIEWLDSHWNLLNNIDELKRNFKIHPSEF